MEFRNLKCFYTFAEELHFARAAVRLHVDQSSVSKCIKELELKLGRVLFFRSSRIVKLTREGDIFYKEIGGIFTLLEHSKNKVRSVNDFNKYFRLAISSHVNVDIHKLSELLRYCREEIPVIDIHVEEINHIRMLKGLSNGDYNFGFSCAIPMDNSLIKTEKILDDRLLLLIPSCHLLVEFTQVSLTALAKYTFICFHLDMVMYKQILMILSESNVAPTKVEYAKSYEVVLSLVTAGLGVSLVTETMYKNINNDNVLTREIVEGLTIGIYILYLQQSLHHPYLKKIADRLCLC